MLWSTGEFVVEFGTALEGFWMFCANNAEMETVIARKAREAILIGSPRPERLSLLDESDEYQEQPLIPWPPGPLVRAGFPILSTDRFTIIFG